MKDLTERVRIMKIKNDLKEEIEDLLVKEYALTIFLNKNEIVTILCSPKDLKFLALGFLYTSGFLKNRKEIKSIRLNREVGTIFVETRKKKDLITNKKVITSGCMKGIIFKDFKDKVFLKSDLKISARCIFDLMNKLQERAGLFKSTGGVHSAALVRNCRITSFYEDIGRHNAVDKIIGECLWKETKYDDKIIIVSGRVSHDLIMKAIIGEVPVVISRSAPTDMAVKLARDVGITLIGFARGKRINIYANAERIVL